MDGTNLTRNSQMMIGNTAAGRRTLDALLKETRVPVAPAKQPEYSIVIPVRNEADNIGWLVNEIHERTAASPPSRIIVVDDASTDDTVRVVERLRQKYGALVELICNERGCGQSTALYNGVEAAATGWIVSMDGDGQNDPADIPAFVDALRGAPRERLLIGNRVSRRDTRTRVLASRVANGVRSRLLRDGTPDTGCGLKAFDREFFLALPYFDHMHRFLPALTRQSGGDVVSMPVRHRPRLHGESKYGVLDRLWAGIVDLLGVAWLARRNKHTGWTRHDA